MTPLRHKGLLEVMENEKDFKKNWYPNHKQEKRDTPLLNTNKLRDEDRERQLNLTFYTIKEAIYCRTKVYCVYPLYKGCARRIMLIGAESKNGWVEFELQTRRLLSFSAKYPWKGINTSLLPSALWLWLTENPKLVGVGLVISPDKRNHSNNA